MMPSRNPLSLSLALLLSGVSNGAMAQEQIAAYQDRVIDAKNLQVLAPDDDEIITNTEGMPRSLQVEGLWSRSERGHDNYDEYGIRVSGYWETEQWGQFSVDSTLFRTNRDRQQGNGGLNGSATIWQRNYYFNNNWRLNNGLGVLNTPSTPLQRQQYRFFLPTVPFMGVSTEWDNNQSKTLIQGSFGRGGNYDGTRMLGFDLEDGKVGSLNIQKEFSPRWTGSAAFLSTDGQLIPNEDGETRYQKGQTKATYIGAQWQQGNQSLQLNGLVSGGDLPSAQGLWVDGLLVEGRYRHNYGSFYLEPSLSWGALPINNDAKGAYYRLAYSYGRWNWNTGVDVIRSISGQGFKGVYGTSYGRYQISSTLGMGGSINVRQGENDTAYSTQWFADRRTRWGQTRVQLDQADGGRGNESWQVSLDQSFPVKTGSRLATTIAYGEIKLPNEASTASTSIGLYGGLDLTERLSIDGNTRWTQGTGPSALRGTDINLGLSWRMSAHFSLSATYYRSEGSQRSPFVLDPLAYPGGYISLPRDQSFFLTLRYQQQAGRAPMTLGGTTGSAVGGISGSIYLDDNKDGLRNGIEVAVPNVTILLDGRFATRSDENGHFEFPRVSTGAHQITIVPDNLPLPWSIPDTSMNQSIQVNVRQDTHLDIGATRP